MANKFIRKPQSKAQDGPSRGNRDTIWGSWQDGKQGPTATATINRGKNRKKTPCAHYHRNSRKKHHLTTLLAAKLKLIFIPTN
jgi:hypothetical protein